ncbi:hypothetical protein SAMN04488072_103215 [Lentibacillus halodurans]|uniref:Uncharacterized protein n=1 Tax=Lentibacillus halodurans TaxID=237679 RepID=A0A1I0WT10_9BACI|nr:hypothetical protein [Lentibacillus halodurans]SFA91083.1 hypothetical protein SAMN04488072_103215 [Lentibacillus halodurans]
MNRLLKRVLALLAIVIIAVQPVFVPAVYAVDSWTGNPWEGESWEGTPWNGTDLQWQGESWEGNSWQGNDTESPAPWSGQNWNQQDGMNGNPGSSDGYSGDGTSPGGPWNMPGYRYGPGGIGNPWLTPDFEGNGTDSDSLDGNGTNGNGTSGNETEGDPTSLEDFSSLPYGYDVGKYIVKDIMMGQAGLIGDLQTYQNMQDMGYNAKMNYGGRFYSNVFMNGLKLGVGDNIAFDSYDTYTHVSDGIGGIKDYNYIRNAQKTTDTAGDLASASSKISGKTPPASSVGALSKFNIAAAAVGTGISAFETGFKSAKAVDVLTSDASGADKTSAVADATASLGDTIMNAGVVTTAIPGGQAIGAGMVAVGAGVWAVSKGVKFVADNWKGNLADTGKAMWNKTKDTAKKAWDTVTGWFS